MKKALYNAISIVAFVLLLGLVGGLERGTLTCWQFIISCIIAFSVMVGAAYKGGHYEKLK